MMKTMKVSVESVYKDSSMLSDGSAMFFLLNRTNTLRFTVFEIGDNPN